MQNKAKFPKSQMNVNKVLTREYEKRTLGEHGKNEPKTNPNEAKCKKAKMNVTDLLTRNYEIKNTWSSGKNEPKTNPNEPN